METKDLELQLEVASELAAERFSELEAAKDYLRTCHAICNDGQVPFGLLHERLLWLVKEATGKDVPMPAKWQRC